MAIVQDEVDLIVHAWRRARPDVDTEPLQVMSRISRLAAVLAERRAVAFGEQGLQANEFDVLSALRRAGAPFELTAGELTGITHVTSGTMTSRLDRLTARNFVSRRADPHDGRLVRVRLTHRGREHVDAAFVALLRSERELLALLPAPQRRALADGLRELLLAAERGSGTDAADG
jgi:DNA-binding MarR family transcriptional regulator